MCTARCLGDSACITGCFARFGNEILDNLLQCSIEDYKCINIAIIAPGAQPADEVPLPPLPLAASFTPASMEGDWYKVLGFNRQYDCFDCQKNSFQVSKGSSEGDGASSAKVDVDFSMIAKRSGRDEHLNGQHMKETMNFDADTFVERETGRVLRSKRSAHTEGRMFGLTFWENWYVLGENKPSEPPFKFVYYTGKTLQNTYSGAFVYARTPELPPGAMDSVYKLAREAGMNPDKMCRIRNSCFASEVNGAGSDISQASSAPPLDAPYSASSSVALAGSQLENSDMRRFSTSIEAPLQVKAKAFWYDVLDYLEDPHEAARWMFDQQQQMVWPFKSGDTGTSVLMSAETQP